MRRFFRKGTWGVAAPLLVVLLCAQAISQPLGVWHCRPASSVPRLHDVKQTLRRYYSSGDYLAEFAAVVGRAKACLQCLPAPEPGSAAVVFDIDETSLSNRSYVENVLLAINLRFGFEKTSMGDWIERGELTALKPTLDLFNTAKERGYDLFFITGRGQSMRDVTEANLSKAGYEGWKKLFLRPADYDEKSIVPYKQAARKRIVKMGYRIVLNVGDQYSDLQGGYAERTVKVPNPFYFIP